MATTKKLTADYKLVLHPTNANVRLIKTVPTTLDERPKVVGSVEIQIQREWLFWKKSTLTTLEVANDHRHKGIGTYLFEQAKSMSREAGCSSLEWTSTKEAIGFYHKMGAHPKDDDRDGIDGVPFELFPRFTADLA